MDSLASRYAISLLEIAKENHQNEFYRSEVKSLIELLKNSEDLRLVFNSAFINKDEKKKIVDLLFEDDSTIYIKNFLKIIIENSRSNKIIEILEEFVKLSNLEDNIAEGYLYSTSRLSDEEIKLISNAIEKKINKKVSLRNRIDNTLIGGVKVVVDDYVFDGSIKNKLNDLHNRLKKGV